MEKMNYQLVFILFYSHRSFNYLINVYLLQIEIDVGSDHQYHSVFACPILRQQSSELNPPMRLVCGHVISRDALNKLGNNANKYALCKLINIHVNIDLNY